MSLTKESLTKLLASRDDAVQRAVVAIWKRQTAVEKQSRDTIQQNGVGFNASDARKLSGYAERINAGLTLNPSELAEARSRVMKYVGQLLEIAMERELDKLAA